MKLETKARYGKCRDRSSAYQSNVHRFGAESVEKMVDWVLNHVPPNSSPSILEVGSGNGALLFALVQSGYDPERILGIDYSPNAVQLARSIATNRGYDRVSFAVCDFLKERPAPVPTKFQGGSGDLWDLMLDKGTFDAIALGVKDADGTLPAARYPAQVATLLKPGAYFLITCMLMHQFRQLMNIQISLNHSL